MMRNKKRLKKLELDVDAQRVLAVAIIAQLGRAFGMEWLDDLETLCMDLVDKGLPNEAA